MIGRVLEREQLAAMRAGGWMSAIAASIFAFLALLAALLAFRTIFPMINPAANVSFPDNLRPSFFVAKLAPTRIWRLFSSSARFAKLAETHDSYCSALQNTSQGDIEKIVAAEVLKVSFIRQVKTDRLAGFAKVLSVVVLVFILLLWFFPPKETSQPNQQSSCTGGNISVSIESPNSPVLKSSRANKAHSEVKEK
jgi:hypothetical protein